MPLSGHKAVLYCFQGKNCLFLRYFHIFRAMKNTLIKHECGLFMLTGITCLFENLILAFTKIFIRL